MSKELPKTYDFKNTETAMYQWWWDQGYFKPINDPKSIDHDPDHKPYVISIPPPNVTGELHLGHAMFVSMEDLMIIVQPMPVELWALVELYPVFALSSMASFLLPSLHLASSD